MTSGNRIDFNEPIPEKPEMITRLKSEHKKFEFDMAKIKTSIKDDNITYGSCCSRSKLRVYHACCTPPNAIVFSSGYVTAGKMARVGLPLDFISIVMVTILTSILVPIVFGI